MPGFMYSYGEFGETDDFLCFVIYQIDSRRNCGE